MTTTESLVQIAGQLSEERLRELLLYAEFLAMRDESAAWREFGLRQLAKAYGDDEPEYTEADIKPELSR